MSITPISIKETNGLHIVINYSRDFFEKIVNIRMIFKFLVSHENNIRSLRSIRLDKMVVFVSEYQYIGAIHTSSENMKSCYILFIELIKNRKHNCIKNPLKLGRRIQKHCIFIMFVLLISVFCS